MKKIFYKMIEKIKKHDNILVFIYFLCVLSIYTYIIIFSTDDELWNFSFIYKMANGYKIYKDLNVIITPLFHFIGKIFFLIFGSNFLIFRIYNIIIFANLYFLIYKLFKNMKLTKKESFVYTIIAFFCTRLIIAGGANYNILVVVFVLLGINLEFLDNNKRMINIFKGLNLFFVFLNKQNVFIYYSIALFIIYIIKLKQNKINIKQITYILVSSAILLITFIIYLNYNGIFEEFISYCFLGILEFSNNKAIDINAVGYIVIGIVSIALSFLLIKLKNTNKNIKNIKNTNYIMLPFSILLVATIYPIFNTYHAIIGIIISIITLMYNLHNIFVIEFIEEKKLNNIINLFIILSTIYFIGYNTYYGYAYLNSKNICKDIEVYKYMIIDDELKNKMTTICEYIKENEKQGYDTKIISYEANLYMNILNKNNKNMDLPFLGNFGKDGEDGVIKEIQDFKDGTKILILKDDKKKYEIYQESKKINDFIMNNYKKLGEIEDYYIYEK